MFPHISVYSSLNFSVSRAVNNTQSSCPKQNAADVLDTHLSRSKSLAGVDSTAEMHPGATVFSPISMAVPVIMIFEHSIPIAT